MGAQMLSASQGRTDCWGGEVLGGAVRSHVRSYQDSWELRCCQLLREGLIVGAERGFGLKGNEGGRGSGDQQMRTVMRTEGQTLKDRRRLVMQRWDLG